MGQILHGCAKTTAAVRRAIQENKESIKALSEKYSVNLKTIRKWKRRNHVHNSPMGPKDPHSPVLSLDEEALSPFVSIPFCRRTIVCMLWNPTFRIWQDLLFTGFFSVTTSAVCRSRTFQNGRRRDSNPSRSVTFILILQRFPPKKGKYIFLLPSIVQANLRMWSF
jgi:hypothetical protein